MNHKKIAAIIGMALTVTMCATPATGHIREDVSVVLAPTNPKKNAFLEMVQEHRAKQLEIKKEKERKQELAKNTIRMNYAMKSLNSYIGKTWYVFSGSTPAGWDCSGLVLWFYNHLGIELYHSATEQMNSGIKVSIPKPGDIVAFQYSGSTRAYHVGIYISKDTMIHSGGKKGDKTEIRSISNFGGSYSKISYIRIADTN